MLGITTVLMVMERAFHIGIFDARLGGDPVLFQHFFWFYSHPAVYIMILPGMAIISEIIPVFAKKTMFGYRAIAFSSVSIAFIGFLVWGHHMFTSGQSDLASAIFAFLTYLVAIPSGIKIWNWLATMYQGSIDMRTPMLYAMSFLVLFAIGGLTGLYLGAISVDIHLHDTYFVVAHFHYVMMGGTVIAFIGGIHYWWPKMFGKMLNERLGKINFWLMFFGVNLTFAPMHILGMQGQPRRMVVWSKKLTGEGFFNLGFWNKVATLGAFTIALGVLVFVINIFVTAKKGEKSPLDPWDARTLEWMTASPPPEHNFDTVPTVHALDEFFHRKYEEVDTDAGPRLVKVKSAEEVLAAEQATDDEHIHLPSPSYWPIVLALALPIIAYGAIFNLLLSVFGVAVLILGIFGWVLEPSVADDSDYDPPAEGSGPIKELASHG